LHQCNICQKAKTKLQMINNFSLATTSNGNKYVASVFKITGSQESLWIQIIMPFLLNLQNFI